MDTRSSSVFSGQPARRYLPALDGIRALAVAAVLAYHAAPSLIPGGFIGVEMFFVVSGFIITRGLIVEYGEHGGVSLGQFWQRRAKRLLPALFVVLSGLLGYATAVEPDRIAQLRDDVLPALTYVTNWYLIFDQQSYFESFGPPSPLRHLWSLAVEEQFYIIWPLAFTVAARRLPARALLASVIAAAGLSSLLMALLYQAGADPSRLYYGTDTRASGFLIGAALALIMARRQLVPAPSIVAEGVTLTVTLILAGLVFTLPSQGRVTYQGGLLVTALLTAMLIVAVLAAEHGPVSRALAVPPLRWLGVRSYGVYLWHWPIVVLVAPDVALPFGGLAVAALQIALALTLAAASYALVEKPVRDGILTALFASRRLAPRGAFLATGSAAILLVTVSACAPSPETPSYMARESVRGFVTPVPVSTPAVSDPAAPPRTPARAPDAPLPDRTSCDEVRGTGYRSASERSWFLSACLTPVAAEDAPSGDEAPAPSAPTVVVSGGATPRAPAPQPPSAPVTTSSVTAVGDSVMLGAADALAAYLGNVYVDAAVSRQASAGVSVLRGLASNGQLGDVVVVHLGNNGTFSQSELHVVMAIAGSSRLVVFVTLKVDRPWEAGNNQAIAGVAASYANARVADWHALSAGSPDLFWDDGIHLRPQGAQAYAQLIASVAGG